MLLGVRQGSIGRLVVHPSTRREPAARTAFAFESTRGDHGFIGLFHESAATVTWVSPSVDMDILPTWSADGSTLAWVRTRASRDDDSVSPLDGNKGNRGPDFEVMVADVDMAPRSTTAAGRGLAASADVQPPAVPAPATGWQ